MLRYPKVYRWLRPTGRISSCLPLGQPTIHRLFLVVALSISVLLALQACGAAEKTIKTGETAFFDVHLEKGQFQAITLEQRDGDLMMTMASPTDEILRVDYYYGTHVEEKLFWKAETSGKYKLAVTPVSRKKDASFHYKLTIHPSRVPTPQDIARLEAQQAYAKAYRLEDELQSGDPKSEQTVADAYEESARKWRDAGEPALCVATLIRAGHFFYEDDKERARSYYQQALEESLVSADLRGQADAYNNLGLVHDDLSEAWEEKQQAKQFFDQSLQLIPQANDLKVEASARSNLGRYYRSIGEYQSALEQYLLSLARMQALGDQGEEALVLANLGVAYRSLGLKSEAERAYNEALKLQREQGDTFEQARIYNGLGRALDLLGDGTEGSKLEAKNQFLKAVSLGKKNEYRHFFEHNLGAVCYELGMIYNRAGELDKARDNFNEAQNHLQEALDLKKRSIRKRAHHTLTSLGLLYHSLGKSQQAYPLLQEALEISRKANDKYQEATVLAALAHIARDRNDLNGAKTKIEEALKIIDTLAIHINVPEWRSSYATAQQHFYDLYADILLRLHSRRPSSASHKVAWQQTERGRLGTYLELLDVVRVSPAQGVDPKLIEELKGLRTKLSYAKPSTYPADQLSGLFNRYQEVERQIRQQNPRYAELLSQTISPGSLNELQHKVLKEDTILLEYALGLDRSYLWAITPTTFEVFVLPPQVQLESAEREVRHAMTGVGLGDSLENGQPETAEEKNRRLKKFEPQYYRASARLSNLLLGPAMSLLGKKKLLIVADGALSRIAFGALPVPTLHPDPSETKFRLLIEDHEIAYAPSAMTLISLHREQDTTKTPVGSVVAIADPVFNSEHKQASHCKDRGFVTASSPGTLSFLADQLANELSPVPFDETEKAKFREGVFGQLPAPLRSELFQFQAKRSNVVEDRLARYRDVIFYTHGLLDEREQRMTGLALSRLNEQCETQDSLLSLNDIYNLRLSADLVTLVACNTARNQTMRGFGIGNIARGFMYAGATRVLGTLWNVDGWASLELVTRAYRNRRAGQSAAEALRTAQLSFLTDGKTEWRHPYYWASFILIGAGN